MVHWITVAIIAILFITEDLHVVLGTVLGAFLILTVIHGFYKISVNRTSPLASSVQSIMLGIIVLIVITGYIDAEDIHEFLSWALVVFLSLHVLGAIRKWFMTFIFIY